MSTQPFGDGKATVWFIPAARDEVEFISDSTGGVVFGTADGVGSAIEVGVKAVAFGSDDDEDEPQAR